MGTMTTSGGRWTSFLCLFLAGATTAASACSTDTKIGGAIVADGSAAADAPMLTGGTTLPDLEKLRVDPVMAMVDAKDGTPGTQQFRAIGTFKGGREQDVTTMVTWTSGRADLATIAATGLATSGTQLGGAVTITATSGALAVAAQLRVRILTVVLGPGGLAVPANPANAFAGKADPARAPELLYPNDGVLFPPNLNRVEVHFRPKAAANNLYEISFGNAFTDVRIYTRCVPLADGCLYEMPQDLWRTLAGTSVTVPMGEPALPVDLRVRATDDQGGGVGTSAVHKLQFSFDQLSGGLYYWSTSTPVAIFRWNFGNTTQKTPERVLGPEAGDGTCIGCHALSRDGKKMVLTMGDANVGNLLLYDVAQKKPLVPYPAAGKSWFESWNPDGSAFVGIDGTGVVKDLLLFDGNTGAQTGKIDLGGLRSDHPDWSVDGNTVAFGSPASWPTNAQNTWDGSIATVTNTAGTWSKPVILAPAVAGKNRYYPAVAPDGSLVVFDESTCSAQQSDDCDTDSDPSARILAVRFPAGGAPVDLTRANQAGVADGNATNLMNSFPKWSPFPLSARSKVFWLTFSSRRRYGLRSVAPGGRDKLGGTLIWMVAVQPDQLAAGKDPSFAPFCLPFQDLSTSNHIAQWTRSVPVVQ